MKESKEKIAKEFKDLIERLETEKEFAIKEEKSVIEEYDEFKRNYTNKMN